MDINEIDDIDELEKAIYLDIAFEKSLSEYFSDQDFHESFTNLEPSMPVNMNDFQKALFYFNHRANIICDITSDQTASLVDLLYVYADLIVEEFYESRDYDKENNPHFKYWKHFCTVEKGKTAVIIRWKKYNGESNYSDAVNKGDLKEFKIPASSFLKCTKTEKKAIMIAEDKFSKIRKINSKMSSLMESIRSIKDITNRKVQIYKDHGSIDETYEIDHLEKYHSEREKTHGKFDRHEFRRSLGL
ncbi:hypothetical protein [Vreelandella arcis]|uniref:Uncharacterized protein n=1 Tax=Vreelandella arcis TaxID=416873 RepID=A0A1H0CYB2_9GAMM|nr:hypothetical protein [Halomonas arcis]SDN62786.1 hypothetical protein SAMN04487951_106241 [Halomonas arcis]